MFDNDMMLNPNLIHSDRHNPDATLLQRKPSSRYGIRTASLENLMAIRLVAIRVSLPSITARPFASTLGYPKFDRSQRITQSCTVQTAFGISKLSNITQNTFLFFELLHIMEGKTATEGDGLPFSSDICLHARLLVTHASCKFSPMSMRR